MQLIAWKKIGKLDMTEVIEAKGLARSFGDLVAVDGIDLSVSEGEVF